MPNNPSYVSYPLPERLALNYDSLHNSPMEYSYHYEVSTQPVPKGRPRFTSRGRSYTPKRTKDFEGLIQLRFLEQHGDEELLDGPLAVRICLFLLRAESHYTPKGNLRKAAPAYPTKSCGDIDNLAKAVLDSANHTIWVDDIQVQDLVVTKRYAQKNEHPGLILSIEPIGEG